MMSTYRYENVEEVFEGGELRDEFLDDFAECLKDRVVVDTGQVKTAAMEGPVHTIQLTQATHT